MMRLTTRVIRLAGRCSKAETGFVVELDVLRPVNANLNFLSASSSDFVRVDGAGASSFLLLSSSARRSFEGRNGSSSSSSTLCSRCGYESSALSCLACSRFSRFSFFLSVVLPFSRSRGGT